MKNIAFTTPALWWQGDVQISAGHSILDGILAVPENARALVVFAHDAGCTRRNERDRDVAAALQREGLATLLFDLLTIEEEHLDAQMNHLGHDIEFLAGRLRAACAWAARQEQTMGLRTGLFGTGVGAATALLAASQDEAVCAIVTRDGRPGLVGDAALRRVEAPTLLIVGEHDEAGVSLNEQALSLLNCTKRMEVVPDTSASPGDPDSAATLAGGWFDTYLPVQGWSV